MRDEFIKTPPGLTPAEEAVNYVLNRIKRDADLRHHMLHTQAFAVLCEAEEKRTGAIQGSAEAFFSSPPDYCAHEKPKLVEIREAAKALISKLQDDDFGDVPEALTGEIEALDRLT